MTQKKDLKAAQSKIFGGCHIQRNPPFTVRALGCYTGTLKILNTTWKHSCRNPQGDRKRWVTDKEEEREGKEKKEKREDEMRVSRRRMKSKEKMKYKRKKGKM